MATKNPFKWRLYESSLILLSVRWYLCYGLSYRNLAEMMVDRGLSVCHTTIYRWVQRFGPEIDKRGRVHFKTTNDSWRVDETLIKVKRQWKYLYRAVDKEGNTLDFLLTAKQDAKAAKRFLTKALAAEHTMTPRVINVDKHAAYPVSVDALKEDKVLGEDASLRQSKYLNNLIEQDHRSIKLLTRPILGFQSFHTAHRTLRGMEAINMIRKGQIKGAAKGDIIAQNVFVDELFRVAV